jgi:hypothetical protein
MFAQNTGAEGLTEYTHCHAKSGLVHIVFSVTRYHTMQLLRAEKIAEWGVSCFVQFTKYCQGDQLKED